MSEFLLHDEQAAQVYLDANATTPVLPCIADVVSHTMQICFGNPSSPHISGIQAKYLLAIFFLPQAQQRAYKQPLFQRSFMLKIIRLKTLYYCTGQLSTKRCLTR